MFTRPRRLATAVLAASAVTFTLTACSEDAGDRALTLGGTSDVPADAIAGDGEAPVADSGSAPGLLGNLDDLDDRVNDFTSGLTDELDNLLGSAGADNAAPTGQEDQGAGVPDSSVDVAGVRATLDTLEVKGRAPKTGYARDEFGPAWKDVDGNGCRTRDDILARDLTDVTYKDGTCQVLTGILDDPYTGQTINFVRGQDTSNAVAIDHVVALSDAWQKGAQQLSSERREQLANDPANLLAVDGPANSQKSDGDAATWLPANKAYRCTYVSKQVEVKSIYGLWVTQAEKDAINRVLDTCGA